jgi:predicted DNA-binding transcriptional regulator YafY
MWQHESPETQMRKSTRLFEIIQLLRSARGPLTAEDLAQALEVSPRTIYRDIAALQAMRTPIAGEAGVGYVLQNGYDLPPLNFDQEEIEALRVGLAMLQRTGDRSLQQAADRVSRKIDALHCPADWLRIATGGAPADDTNKGCVSIALLRQAIRDERKLRLTYRDVNDAETTRTVRPVALVYHLDCTLLASWCELRGGFRHFRTERIWGWDLLEDDFKGQGQSLRDLLQTLPEEAVMLGQSA